MALMPKRVKYRKYKNKPEARIATTGPLAFGEFGL